MDESVSAVLSGTPDTGRHRAGASRATVRTPAAWLGAALHGLTWRRYAIFSLVLLAIALSESPAIRSLQGDASWIEKLLDVLRVWAYVLLIFTPVLLLVVAVDNLVPTTGRKRVVALVAAVAAGQAIGTLIWFGVVRILYPAGFMPYLFGNSPDPMTQLRYFSGYGVLLGSLSMTATAFWYLLRRNQMAAAMLDREHEQREEAEHDKAEAELAMMQAQVEPHFLFNTLASVRRLYETDPVSGRTMLRELSRYLTASLPIVRQARSTLGRELALAVAYLNVHKIRMGARLDYDVDVPSTLLPLAMPPMMLATLVENAVIHGLNPLPEGGTICICARADTDGFTLQVTDTGQGLRGTWGGGVGLANIRARLASEFGASAALMLTEGPGRGVTASLSLPHVPRAEGAA